jgi:hypothetical protein
MCYCKEQDVENLTTSYTPQQNDVMKRRDQTLLATARALLKQRKILARY